MGSKTICVDKSEMPLMGSGCDIPQVSGLLVNK